MTARQWALIGTVFTALCWTQATGAVQEEATRDGPGPQELETAARGLFTVCGRALALEIARTRAQLRQGLMYRDGLKPGTGMIFVYKPPKWAAIWMRNMRFPIDVGFFDREGRLINFERAVPAPDELPDDDVPRYRSESRAAYAVEVTAGFFSRIDDPDACTLSPLP